MWQRNDRIGFKKTVCDVIMLIRWGTSVINVMNLSLYWVVTHGKWRDERLIEDNILPLGRWKEPSKIAQCKVENYWSIWIGSSAGAGISLWCNCIIISRFKNNPMTGSVYSLFPNFSWLPDYVPFRCLILCNAANNFNIRIISE